MRHTPWKKGGGKITADFLKERAERSISAGYQKQKWVTFCETLMSEGYTLRLYEARKTASKYVTVCNGAKAFKVRFSNHKPIFHREMAGDCDFFVGVCNKQVTTTIQALDAVRQFFKTEGSLNG